MTGATTYILIKHEQIRSFEVTTVAFILHSSTKVKRHLTCEMEKIVETYLCKLRVKFEANANVLFAETLGVPGVETSELCGLAPIPHDDRSVVDSADAPVLGVVEVRALTTSRTVALGPSTKEQPSCGVGARPQTPKVSTCGAPNACGNRRYAFSSTKL